MKKETALLTVWLQDVATSNLSALRVRREMWARLTSIPAGDNPFVLFFGEELIIRRFLCGDAPLKSDPACSFYKLCLSLLSSCVS